ncbi:MAG: hypothetical protein WCT36_03170, partial [Candidatus Gracilibacteria bacterium]
QGIFCAQIYRALNRRRNAIRNAALAVTGYIREPGAEKYAYKSAEVLDDLGLEEYRIEALLRDPAQGERDAYRDLPRPGYAPRYSLNDVNNEIESLISLRVTREISPIILMNMRFYPASPNADQKRCLQIVIEESKVLMELLGVKTERAPDTEDVVFLDHSSFTRLVSNSPNSGAISTSSYSDGFNHMDRVYIDASQSNGDLMHTLAHELFGHQASATKFVGLRKNEIILEKHGLLRLKNGVKKSNPDYEYEIMDELLTEVSGYLLRLLIIHKYGDQLTDLVGKKGMEIVSRNFTSGPFTNLIFDLAKRVAKKRQITEFSALRAVLESYYSGSDEFDVLMKEAFGSFSNVLRLMELNESTASLIHLTLGDYLNPRRMLADPNCPPVFPVHNEPLSEPMFMQANEFIKERAKKC